MKVTKTNKSLSEFLAECSKGQPVIHTAPTRELCELMAALNKELAND